MRIFWGLILILVLGSAGYLYGRLPHQELPHQDQSPAQVSVSEPAQFEPLPAAAPAATEPIPDSPPPTEPQASPAAAPVAAEVPKSPQPDPDLDASALDAMLGTVAGAAQPEPTAPPPAPAEAQPVPPPEPPLPAPDAPPANVPAALPATDASSVAAVPPTPPASEAPASGPPVAATPKPATFAGFELLPATRTLRDDGSLLLDDHYVVSGKGTEAEPFKITWDLLTSSSQTLAPRQGKKRLPERITMFDGTWVELSGYIAFPLMVQEADELLLMLNQWDGCCIGVPPTPYDAIEVSLTKKVKGQDRFAVQGSLKGKLGVRPHLVGEWLVGVYVMDSATLSTKAVGGVSQ
jgi:hypothetical protein